MNALQSAEVSVQAAAGDEFVMCADFLDDTFFHRNDLIGVFHRGEPVRHDEGGAILHEGGERYLDLVFTFCVQSARCFVENKDGGVFKEGSRDGEALPLAAREPVACFAHGRVKPLGEGGNEVCESGGVNDAADVFIRCLRRSVANVVANGAVKRKLPIPLARL